MPDTIKQLQLQRRMDALETEYHDKRDPKVKKEFERLSTELARLKVNQVVDSKEKAQGEIGPNTPTAKTVPCLQTSN
jgi:hypothetical protein